MNRREIIVGSVAVAIATPIATLPALATAELEAAKNLLLPSLWAFSGGLFASDIKVEGEGLLVSASGQGGEWAFYITISSIRDGTFKAQFGPNVACLVNVCSNLPQEQ